MVSEALGDSPGETVSFWIELHCDSDLDDRPGFPHRPCAASVHEYPSMFVMKASNMGRVNRELSAEAKRIGWIKTKKGWRCKACVDWNKNDHNCNG